MKIRAAVLEETGIAPPYAQTQPLKIREVDLAPPGRGEVLVRVAAAGICHSDLSVVNGDRPRPVPMVLGHEASGVVAALGEGVDDLRVGDHVVSVFVSSCGHCGPCAEGRPALCEPAAKANGAGELVTGGRRLARAGQPIHHHIGVSGFADHAVVARHGLVKVDPEVPLDHAALFGCAVLTGVGAVINAADSVAGKSIAVIGLGGVGLAALLGAVLAGAERIVAMDLAPDKLALAKTLGATDTVKADIPDAAAAVRELTGGGVHLAVEMAGSVRALELAYAVTRRGGTTVTGGLPNPAHMLSIPAVSLVAEERTLKGSYIGTSVPSRDLPRYLALYKRGRLPVDRLLTHRLALDDINLGLDRLRQGEAIRQIVTF